MNSIQQINNKLKYTEYYNMSNEDWAFWSFYSSLNDELVNDYDFLNTFKDKIYFHLLYTYKHNIKPQIIEKFINEYGIHIWPTLFTYYPHIFTEEFFNKHYMYMKVRHIPLNIYLKLNKNKLKDEVKTTLMKYV